MTAPAFISPWSAKEPAAIKSKLVGNGMPAPEMKVTPKSTGMP
jgi:hypothetical protein